MSILQDISKQLIAVASMPPENRNSALMEVLIAIEDVQYDMVLEQKDLIMNIIEDLIAENDADQIAKSKLVFVPDVEEQIAPTKKTRAKKVVTPVVEVIGEDLPDFIAKLTIIKDLPKSVQKLAILRKKQLTFSQIDVNDLLSRAFDWTRTPEGDNFWMLINTDGDLREFKRKYGNKGEKVDELIEFAELSEFVEGLLQPVESEDLPDFIDSEIKIQDLPEKIKLLALQRQKDAGNIPNENLFIDAFKENGNFDWFETPEGNEFWEIISAEGDLRQFKKRYGNKGEGVDAIINPPAQAVKTRKPRTPKVPAVAQSTLADLPDTTGKRLAIKDLPLQVQKLIILRNIEQGDNTNFSNTLSQELSWSKTEELSNFWEEIFNGNLTRFKKRYGTKGEKVDELIEDAQQTDFVELTLKQNAPAKAPTPVVKKQKLLFLRLIFNPPVGSAIKLEIYNPEELHYAVIGILNKLDFTSLTFNFEAVTDFSSYLTNQKLFYHYEPNEIVDMLIEKFDMFVTPELDWSDFSNNKTDFSRINDNKTKLEDAFIKTPKPVKVVTPKVVTPKVVTPKVVTPKPVKVVTPKPVPVEKPKPVKVATPKPKVSKPKVEDDLSFLDDLNNIF